MGWGRWGGREKGAQKLAWFVKINPLTPKSDLQISLSITPDNFAPQRGTP